MAVKSAVRIDGASRKRRLSTRARSILRVELLESRCMLAGNACDNVVEANEYSLVYELAVDPATFSASQYSVDDAANFAAGNFDRIAYYVELDSVAMGNQWVWVSMDAFTRDASQIGVPALSTNAFFQQSLENLNVRSNSPNVTEATSVTGNIEFWPSDYSAGNTAGVPGASDAVYDFGDGGASLTSGYGSMQIHNSSASETLFAYNNWNNATVSDLGIGNSPAGELDWTIAANGSTYTARSIQVFVRPADPPSPAPAPQRIVTLVPEAAEYHVVHELPIQQSPFISAHYSTDDSSLFRDAKFDRVAYFLELESAAFGTQWVWAALDAFTEDAAEIGVPGTSVTQGPGSNLDVISNVAGVTNGHGFAAAEIEFWPTNYAATNSRNVPGASAQIYDFGDSRQAAGTYGSMQIHNVTSGEVVFAYNRWGALTGEVGIGNNANGHTDWTFTDNSSIYTVKQLTTLVRHQPGDARLVANWPFDTDFNDRSGNAHHGTPGGQPIAGAVQVASPLGGGYLQLDGVDDFVAVEPLITDSSYAKAAWVRLDSARPDPVASIYSGDGDQSHRFFVDTNVDRGLAASNNGVAQVEDTNAFTQDAWIHVAVSYDAVIDQLVLYRDGQVVSRSAGPVGTAAASSVADLIGAYGGDPVPGDPFLGDPFLGDPFLGGQLDDVVVWDNALSDAKIAEVYQDGLNGQPVFDPPGVPSGLIVDDFNHLQVDLHWDSLPEADEYVLRRDGVVIARLDDTDFSDATVAPHTLYSYDVAAEDYRGRSSFSAAINVTTLELPPSVTFIELPADSQLYPRDRDANSAEVAIVGTVDSGTFDRIVLRTYRDGVPFGTEIIEPLQYVDGTAAFDLRVDIVAELSSYDFELLVADGPVFAELAKVDNVVAGDIFLVQGQSNADAQQYSGTAGGNEGPFLRTFGINSSVSTTTTSNTQWQQAAGDGSNGIVGGIGQWAVGLGRQLVDEYQIPIAILNGAHGGRPIGFFQRNDLDPLDLNTNYGRLLYRAELADVADSVRGILWYQGESDNGAGQIHEDGFVELYNDWHADYPEVEKVYVHQIRVGCGVVDVNVDLRDRQRRLQDRFDDIVVVSTTGIDAHDGCHYAYANGYEEIGNRAFALVARDLYAAQPVANIESPNLAGAYFTSPNYDEITLVMRNATDTLVFDSGAAAHFRIDGVNVAVTSGQAVGNKIVLTLSGSGSAATGVSYIGHSGAGPWVSNAAGVGMFTFYESNIYDANSLLTVDDIAINSDFVDPPNLPGQGPQPTSWMLQRSDLRSLIVTLNFPADVELNDLTLTNLGVDADADNDTPIVLAPQHFTASESSFALRFAENELPKGVYQLSLSGAVSDRLGRPLDGNADGVAGDDYQLVGNVSNRFHKLEADWNGDQGVSVFDFTTFSYWFGQSNPDSPAYADLNNDAGVSVFDFTGFSLNFGVGVRYPVGLAAHIEEAHAANLVETEFDESVINQGEKQFESPVVESPVVETLRLDRQKIVTGLELKPTHQNQATSDDPEQDELLGELETTLLAALPSLDFS